MGEFGRFKEKVWLSSPTMHGEELDFVHEAFDSNWIAPLGKNVRSFEREVAEYIGVNASAACVSGTSALFLAYKLAGVKPGDTVLCSDFTFAATVNPIEYLGGKQVFVDSEYDTWNMSPEALEEAFELHPEAKVVGLVHLYGTPSKVDEIKAICKKYNAILIEDAAEALGATYKGEKCGSFGEYAILSYNGNKIITTSGGGMLLSNNEDDIRKAVFLSTQARDKAPWYQHSEIGYNFRMSNVVAGIGRGQLLHIDEHIELKKRIYMRYKEGLKELPVTMNPYDGTVGNPNFWLSCMVIDKGCSVKPLEIMDKLADYNIESRPIWKPMHMQPVYEYNDFISTGVGEDIFRRGLCLPSDIKMSAEIQNIVINIIKSCFEK